MTHSPQQVKFKSQIVDKVTSLFEDFLDAEQSLFSREVHGIRYWHAIRFMFLNEIFAAKKWMRRISPGRESPIVAKAAIAFGLLKNSLVYPVTRDRYESDILILNSANRVLRDGEFIDPLTGTWSSEFAGAFTLWEAPTVWRHPKHGRNSRQFYLDSLLVKTVIRQALASKQKSIQSEARCLAEFAKEFDVELPETKIAKMIAFVAAVQASCREAIRNQLLKKRVRLIVMLNHYDPLKMLITTIAKSLGIYVLELQHGNLGKYQIPYNFRSREKLVALPNEILTFGKFWNETTRITQNGVKLTAVGMPFLEEKVAKLARPKKSKKTTILILSQDTIADRLAALALELLDRLDPSEYDICYKLHPREVHNWKLTYPREFASSAINICTGVDVYELMSISDVHIGIYSTTIMESLAFGKRPILLEAYGVHFHAELIKTGRAILAKNVEDVLDAMQSAQPLQTDPQDTTYYWEQNSKAKITRRLQEILA